VTAAPTWQKEEATSLHTLRFNPPSPRGAYALARLWRASATALRLETEMTEEERDFARTRALVDHYKGMLRLHKMELAKALKRLRRARALACHVR
jgi:hypothetical protein